MKIAFLFILAYGFIFCHRLFAEETYFKAVASDRVEVRAFGSNYRYASVRGVLNKGDTVYVTEVQNGWALVKTENGESGWVKLEFLKAEVPSDRKSQSMLTTPATSSSGAREVFSTNEISEIKRLIKIGAIYETSSPVLFNGGIRPESFLEASKGNDSKAWVNLGTLYLSGIGIQANHDEAFKLLLKAAESGDSQGQATLGFMYDRGWGVPKNIMQAISLYALAVSQDNPRAQWYVGELYSVLGDNDSQNTKRNEIVGALPKADTDRFVDDYARSVMVNTIRTGSEKLFKTKSDIFLIDKNDPRWQSFAWFKRSADSGFAFAQRDLARLYFDNCLNWDGVSYLLLATQQDDRYANAIMKKRLFEKQACEPQMIDQLQMLASRGDSNAQYWLGYYFANHPTLPRDIKEAAKWYALAAEGGNASAFFELGTMAELEVGSNKNFQEALVHYEKAVRLGKSSALCRIGLLKTYEGVQSGDYRESLQAYRLAADQGEACGSNGLGEMYMSGIGVPQDNEKALKLIIEAAKMGCPDACANYARVLLEGSVVERDAESAIEWYTKAAKSGHSRSQVQLAVIGLKGETVDKDKELWPLWLSLAAKQNDPEALLIIQNLTRDQKGVYTTFSNKSLPHYSDDDLNIPKRYNPAPDSSWFKPGVQYKF